MMINLLNLFLTETKLTKYVIRIDQMLLENNEALNHHKYVKFNSILKNSAI